MNNKERKSAQDDIDLCTKTFNPEIRRLSDEDGVFKDGEKPKK